MVGPADGTVQAPQSPSAQTTLVPASTEAAAKVVGQRLECRLAADGLLSAVQIKAEVSRIMARKPVLAVASSHGTPD